MECTNIKANVAKCGYVYNGSGSPGVHSLPPSSSRSPLISFWMPPLRPVFSLSEVSCRLKSSSFYSESSPTPCAFLLSLLPNVGFCALFVRNILMSLVEQTYAQSASMRYMLGSGRINKYSFCRRCTCVQTRSAVEALMRTSNPRMGIFNYFKILEGRPLSLRATD